MVLCSWSPGSHWTRTWTCVCSFLALLSWLEPISRGKDFGTACSCCAGLKGSHYCIWKEELRLLRLCSFTDEKEEMASDRLHYSLQLHPWVTKNGVELLPTEDENCTLVEVTEEEVENSVKHIPSLATVVSSGDSSVLHTCLGRTSGWLPPPGSTDCWFQVPPAPCFATNTLNYSSFIAESLLSQCTHVIAPGHHAAAAGIAARPGTFPGIDLR